MTQKLTGQMIHEAFRPDNSIHTEWKYRRSDHKIDFIKAAQRLNVQLGLISPDAKTYILDDELSVIEVSNLKNIKQALMDMEDGDFKLTVIQNGKETGYGHYKIVDMDLTIGIHMLDSYSPLIEEEYAAAEGLGAQINEIVKQGQPA